MPIIFLLLLLWYFYAIEDRDAEKRLVAGEKNRIVSRFGKRTLRSNSKKKRHTKSMQ